MQVCSVIVFCILKHFSAYYSWVIFTLQFNVDRANAEEFFEVYKGVVKEYSVSINTTLLCIIVSSCIMVLFHSITQTLLQRSDKILTVHYALFWFLHLLHFHFPSTGHDHWAVLWTLHGPRDPWHQRTTVIQRILWAPRSSESNSIISSFYSILQAWRTSEMLTVGLHVVFKW